MVKLYFIVICLILFDCWCFKCFSCTVKIVGYSPLFIRRVNFHRVILDNKHNEIQMDVGDAMEAHCSGELRLQSDRNYSTTSMSIVLQCQTLDTIFYRDYDAKRFISHSRGEMYISCISKITYTLFESLISLPQCEGLSTYVVGAVLPHARNIAPMAICYDSNKFKWRYIAHLVYYPTLKQSKTMNTLIDLESISLDFEAELPNYVSIGTYLMEDKLKEIKKTFPVIRNFEFVYLTGVPDTAIVEQLGHNSNLFRTVWWHGLRFGNWELFLRTLDDIKEETVTLFFYLGTNGKAKLPVDETETTTTRRTTSNAYMFATDNENTYIAEYDTGFEDANDNANDEQKSDERAFSFEVDHKVFDVPEYIWMFVKWIGNNESADFVVFAYNSPFGALVDLSSVIFCKDVCKDIFWIRTSEFYATRLLTGLGIMFCCSPSDAASKIEHFPYAAKKEMAATRVEVNYEITPWPQIIESDHSPTINDVKVTNATDTADDTADDKATASPADGIPCGLSKCEFDFD